LGEGATKDISGALNALLADVFALYMKTKELPLAHVGATFSRRAPPTRPKYGADGMPHGWVDNPLVFVANR